MLPSTLGMQMYDFFPKLQILFEKDFSTPLEMTEFNYLCRVFRPDFCRKHSAQWGCFGFDSIRHWAVSTPGTVGQPVNLDLQTISWQQLLCTRCVVCKAHYLNPRSQGCFADEYPSRLYAGYGWNMGYHSNRMLGVTPLSSAKIQRISLE